ncbi:DNA cytosine methyltransferase [Sphingopyxis indica]|uniref:Cytosine-specific methyltransferase n=1 Tax=Sphingopyxis indica TaxID=436663 RepID=A0A239DFM2_9SPHN|nr:DNA (cytosine-5-)-methyltransferase [Sphingopyxis indica]SNS31129.1 DNA (cytosine-5)-methyltransferase 1 [Sphingopyxis indica]
MKAAALFSGIGGFCLGFERTGISTSWAIEVDHHAAETYAHNLPQVKLLRKDIREISVAGDGLEEVDVLHAGFPCQSFSQAGTRSGFEDERGQLFFDVIRLLKEFGERRPRILVLENAPFLRYGEGGAWFLRLQNEIRKAGYWFREENAAELNAYKLTHLPQQRVRLFMVALSTAHFSSGRFSFPVHDASEHKILSDFINFETDVEEEYYLPKDNRYYHMINGAAESDRQIYQLRKYLVRTKEPGVCPTLTANMGLGGHNVPFIFGPSGLRKLTEYECLALQGFPEDFKFPDQVPRAKRYTQVGNAVAVPVAERLGRSVAEKLNGETVHDKSRLRIPA